MERTYWEDTSGGPYREDPIETIERTIEKMHWEDPVGRTP